MTARPCALAVLIAALLARPAAALGPDELALLANASEPASVRLAEFYAKARRVPADRIIRLDLPRGDEISFERFERDVVPAIRAALRERGLEKKVRCLVTFYGMPLRIGAHRLTADERRELAEVRQIARQTSAKIATVVAQAEELAKRADATFAPGQGESLDQLGQRAEAAMRMAATALRGRADNAGDALQLVNLLGEFSGHAGLLAKFTDAQLAQMDLAIEVTDWASRRAAIEAGRIELTRRKERRFDANDRKAVRDLVSEHFGLFALAKLLEAQALYLDDDGTLASFDNELALLWWDYYARAKWQLNPMYHRARPRSAGAPPVLMAARLDAPREERVRQMILDGLAAEQEGLRGAIVIDSRGIPSRKKNGADDGYGVFDESLRNLAALVKSKTEMPLTFDENPELLPAATIENIALYCGWHQPRRYAGPFDFVPGAVAIHVASFEMVSLRGPEERGWVAGLLNDGAAATLGPVAEPYLHAFPRADEFFPLLMTGELTLAEVYWCTAPLTSWMLALVGDPLYRPFAARPALSRDDLSPSLREATARLLKGAEPGAISPIPEASAGQPP